MSCRLWLILEFTVKYTAANAAAGFLDGSATVIDSVAVCKPYSLNLIRYVSLSSKLLWLCPIFTCAPPDRTLHCGGLQVRS